MSRFLLMAGILVLGTNALEAGPNRRFSQVDLDQGLSHRTVYAIHQDRQGFMWFGTQNGLNRYDGVRFQVYHKRSGQADSFSDDNINSIFEDEAGNLWLGTWGGGLNCFNPRTGKVLTWRFDPANPDSLSSDYVQCLSEGKNGTLWIGTLDGGLCRFDRKSGTVTRLGMDVGDPHAPQHRRVWSVHEQEDGLVWVGTEMGLYLLDPRRNQFLPLGINLGPLALDLGKLSIRVLYAPNAERLWIGLSMGLLRLDLKTRELTQFPTSSGWGTGLDKPVINVLREDRKGNLLIGTLNEGLKILDSHSGEIESHTFDPRDPFSLSGNDVRALWIDQSENLWVGTRGSGLSKHDLKRQKFQVFAHKPGEPNSLPFGDIRSLTTDILGQLWVGTLSNGLTQVDRTARTFTHHRNDPSDPYSLPHNNVTALGFDSAGNLLVGTFDGLARRETNGRFTTFRPIPGDATSLIHERVFAVKTDLRQRTWVGTHRGLCRFDGTRFYRYDQTPQRPNGLPPGPVLVVYEDSAGHIWAGMDPSGLYRYRPETDDFEAYHTRPGVPRALAENEVLSLCEGGGALWIGTMGGGLVSMDPLGKEFHTIDQQKDQVFNNVYGILPGDSGTLWVSTNKGLGRLDPNSREIRLYGIFDGAQSPQFSLGAYHRSSTGELFFGGIEGVNVFREEDVQDHYFIPRVIISSLEVDGKEIAHDLAQDSKIVIDPPSRGVTFSFAALDYTRPAMNQFQYKLEGLDLEWLPATTHTFATYPALAPGTYTFHVKGSNHDGVWNPNATSLTLTVTSPFFRTWFYYLAFLSCVLLLTVALLAFFRYRQNNLLRMQALEQSERQAVEANRSKSTFLAHLSHELRTPLNAIIGFTELIEEDLNDYNPTHFRPKQCKEDLGKIKSSAYLQLAQVNNLLELTRLESGKCELYIETFNVKTMVKAVLHHIEPMLSKTANQLEVRFDPEEIGDMTADFMKVQGILINLLSNANKFTKKGTITLTVSRSLQHGGNMVCFQISDTGCGIRADQLSNLFDGFTMAYTGRPNQENQLNGIGLYLSSQFAKMMGGEIQVESQVSKGSTFSVVLPTIVRT